MRQVLPALAFVLGCSLAFGATPAIAQSSDTTEAIDRLTDELQRQDLARWEAQNERELQAAIKDMAEGIVAHQAIVGYCQRGEFNVELCRTLGVKGGRKQ
jgi:hypothetical protein